jgi:hypothetical protein
MPSGDRRVPFDKMRERARAQVEATSLRHVAADVGIDYNALNRFINGSKPRAKNAQRLEAWYSAEAGKVDRLERENAELRKALAACEAKLKRK